MTAPDVVFAALTAAFPIQKQGSLVEIRRSDEEAVLMFRWRPHRQLFGVPLSLTQTHRRLDGDQPAEDLDDWLESVDLWLMEDVENGFLYRARRMRVDDYIELRGPEWPMDQRFYADIVSPRELDSWLRVPFLADDGLDPEVAVMRREARTLIAWVTAYENNASGSPYVGQATIVRDSPKVARLDYVELVDGAPSTLGLEIVRTATHAAADSGFQTVVTDLDLPHLEVTGFRPASDGQLTVDTTFLEEDPTAAEGIFRAALADPGLWGHDRDAAGRYLPRSRAGRLMHLLRYGRSGARPRIYVG